jgi:hypothetical protein
MSLYRAGEPVLEMLRYFVVNFSGFGEDAVLGMQSCILEPILFSS